MKKLSIYFTFIIGLFSGIAKAQSQIIVDSASTKMVVFNAEIVPKVTLWSIDSAIYAQRLDSLNSPMPLVYNPQVQKYITI